MDQDATGVSNTGLPANIARTGESNVLTPPDSGPNVQRAPFVAWLPEEDGPEHSSNGGVKWPLVTIVIGAVVIAFSLLLLAVTQPRVQPVAAPIVANHDMHLIERVPYDSHAVPVRFRLESPGAPLVTEVSTNQQCASARLFQGDRTSPWLARNSQANEAFADLQLTPFKPAYLEVSIDPTAHGPSGDVALEHNVLVKTADGQVLSFEVLTGSK
jgi:hypothetical protein